MIEKLISALEENRGKEARWLAEAILLSRGESKTQRSGSSTKGDTVPLSAVDLLTLLDILLEIQTLPAALMAATSRSKLKLARANLQKSNGTNSVSGQRPEPTAPSPPPPRKPLHSNRRFWPSEAKDVFWHLVRQLNKYDKGSTEEGHKSPLQLATSEAATRSWWRSEYEIYAPSLSDRKDVEAAASALGGCEITYLNYHDGG